MRFDINKQHINNAHGPQSHEQKHKPTTFVPLIFDAY